MKFLDKLFPKKKRNIKEVSTEALYTRVVYCTPTNMSILIQYSQNYFQSMIEFADACYKSYIPVIYANSAIEKELTKEESAEFDKKAITLIDHRHYALISAPIGAYQNIYIHIHSLSNDILEHITKDIYNRCAARDFKRLLDDGIMSKSLFLYQQIEPVYDKFIYIDNTISRIVESHDDIGKIKSLLPNCFSAIDLLQIIRVYYRDSSFPRLINTAEYIIKCCVSHDYTPDTLGTFEAIKPTLYSHVMDNPTIEALSIVDKPMYMRPDINDTMNSDVPLEQLDEIFQQQYDRFEQPTVDYAEYEDIDEVVSEDEYPKTDEEDE